MLCITRGQQGDDKWTINLWDAQAGLKTKHGETGCPLLGTEERALARGVGRKPFKENLRPDSKSPPFFCGGIGDSAGATRRERSGSGANEKGGGCKKNSKQFIFITFFFATGAKRSPKISSPPSLLRRELLRSFVRVSTEGRTSSILRRLP